MSDIGTACPDDAEGKTVRFHAMKDYREVELQLCSFSTSELDGGE